MPSSVPSVGSRQPPAVLPVHILPQPDDETCGPTCLHAVYRFWGDEVDLPAVIESAESLRSLGIGRGTLAVLLGIDALLRGYRATLYTFNLEMFDPSWFNAGGHAEGAQLAAKLHLQALAKRETEPRLAVATPAYLEFLRLGGTISLCDLTSSLISRLIRSGRPILTGLSATYLYRCPREWGPKDDYDDLRGTPAGHFVVLTGYDPRGRRVTVADPLADNPGFATQQYTVPVARLVPAVMLGVLTHDANLLIIEPADAGDGLP